MKINRLYLIFGLGSMMALRAIGSPDIEINWPQWRGPLQNGVAPQADPPVIWSETNNVKWKKKLPGEGSATPVIWENKIFVVTATGNNRGVVKGVKDGPMPKACRWIVLCLDRATGGLVWENTAREGLPLDLENEGRNNTLACYSPITDGERLYASFGSAGVYCYDFEGNVRWKYDLQGAGIKAHGGEGGSPVLCGGTLLINWDHTGCDFMTALDTKSGRILWKAARNERNSWFTPVVIEHNGKAEIVTNGEKRIQSYDVATGQLLWECAGLDGYSIPSPVAGQGLAYLMTGFAGNNKLLAIRLGHSGNLDGRDAVAWLYHKNTSYIASPLLYDDYLYFIGSNQNIISCLNATTGKPLIEAERLSGLGETYASPVGAADRIYILDRSGHCAVIKRGPQLEVLAVNSLSDRFDSSPALAGREIVLRGRKSVYCLSEGPMIR